MLYTTTYRSPLGEMTLAEKNGKLAGLWLNGQKYFLSGIKEELVPCESREVFIKTRDWLDRYFYGDMPSADELELAPVGSDFRQTVWKILCEIPYGETVTYGEIAEEAAKRLGLEHMSAQAVGNAVGHNPISVIIPCHRVVGADGSLTGYAGGIDKKIYLLRHEGLDMSRFKTAKKA